MADRLFKPYEIGDPQTECPAYNQTTGLCGELFTGR